jgi:hypothetical protein
MEDNIKRDLNRKNDVDWIRVTNLAQTDRRRLSSRSPEFNSGVTSEISSGRSGSGAGLSLIS